MLYIICFRDREMTMNPSSDEKTESYNKTVFLWRHSSHAHIIIGVRLLMIKRLAWEPLRQPK